MRLGRIKVASTNVVQTSAGSSGSIQPAANAKSPAGALSVRRRLSIIFQRPIRGSSSLTPDAAAAIAGETENPGQELPVSARPAVVTLGAHVVSRRKIVDDLDIRGEARARESPLEQVMAQ